MKKIICLIVSLVMILSVSITSFALQSGVVFRPGDTTIYDGNGAAGPIRYATGKVQNFPGWAWINGYCYYFTNPNYTEKLTNTTTPDGCQVDAEGRWCVNGVPQHNGYGSFACGTYGLYAGKDDNARWTVMKDQLERLYAENYSISNKGQDVAMLSMPTMVQAGEYGTFQIVAFTNGLFVTADLPLSWCDAPNAYWNMGDEMMERTIKLLVGDHVGQELFNDLRAAGESAVGGGNAFVYNADGTIKMEKKLIYDEEFGTSYYRDMAVMVPTGSTSDGINWGAFPASKWKNRKTDYGKYFSVYRNPSVETSFIIDIVQ